MKKQTRLFVVILLGIFGVHKFIDKQYKVGFLYLFTGGLFGIGWIIDIIKELTNSASNHKSMMDSETINLINEGKLPNIIASNLNLMQDEICHYADEGITFKDKIVTSGYTGKSSGVSIRVMKGITYRTGGSEGKAIKETQRTTYKGILYVTNKRVIYNSNNECFDKPLNKITSIQEAKDGVIVQIGSMSYSIILYTHSEFIKVFNMVKTIS